nr:zinc-ribbon domain containing protein [Paenibacillus hamazuiensis]
MENPGEGKFTLEEAPADSFVPASELLQLQRGPERIKCWDCGERFYWTVEEQDHFRMRGWDPPKRCSDCREKKRMLRDGLLWSELDW